MDDTNDEATAFEKAMDDAIDREWDLKRDFADAQAEADETRKKLHALESGDHEIKDEATELWETESEDGLRSLFPLHHEIRPELLRCTG